MATMLSAIRAELVNLLSGYKKQLAVYAPGLLTDLLLVASGIRCAFLLDAFFFSPEQCARLLADLQKKFTLMASLRVLAVNDSIYVVNLPRLLDQMQEDVSSLFSSVQFIDISTNVPEPQFASPELDKLIQEILKSFFQMLSDVADFDSSRVELQERSLAPQPGLKRSSSHSALPTTGKTRPAQGTAAPLNVNSRPQASSNLKSSFSLMGQVQYDASRLLISATLPPFLSSLQTTIAGWILGYPFIYCLSQGLKAAFPHYQPSAQPNGHHGPSLSSHTPTTSGGKTPASPASEQHVPSPRLHSPKSSSKRGSRSSGDGRASPPQLSNASAATSTDLTSNNLSMVPLNVYTFTINLTMSNIPSASPTVSLEPESKAQMLVKSQAQANYSSPDPSQRKRPGSGSPGARLCSFSIPAPLCGEETNFAVALFYDELKEAVIKANSFFATFLSAESLRKPATTNPALSQLANAAAIAADRSPSGSPNSSPRPTGKVPETAAVNAAGGNASQRATVQAAGNPKVGTLRSATAPSAATLPALAAGPATATITLHANGTPHAVIASSASATADSLSGPLPHASPVLSVQVTPPASTNGSSAASLLVPLQSASARLPSPLRVGSNDIAASRLPSGSSSQTGDAMPSAMAQAVQSVASLSGKPSVSVSDLRIQRELRLKKKQTQLQQMKAFSLLHADRYLPEWQNLHMEKATVTLAKVIV